MKTDQARKILEGRRPKYADCESLTEEKLNADKLALEKCRTELEKRREDLKTAAHLQKYAVLAATADTCIQRLPPDGELVPAHIFLDEAGYCALIKGAALLAYHCPVTFLGDHMQLPPVCEMPDDDISVPEAADVCLWAQSALYAEDIFSLPPAQIAENYIHNQPAQFERMARFDLTHTYRFGEELAQVLAQSVYSKDFHGSMQHSTEIYFINTPKSPKKEKKRTSQSECAAITAYVRIHADEQIGIITPYKNQKEAIFNAVPDMEGREDNVLTVHGSQGREWDTVLLSVVDTKDKWFTNSNCLESNGKKLINTAVSRAKRKLILVCDAEYWKTQSSQLIGRLLDVATACPWE